MRRIEVTAIHEAGHAFAAQLRGATITSITLAPGEVRFKMPRTRQKLFHNGEQIADPLPVVTDPFVYFGGPWAEARAWYAVDLKNGRKHTFSDYLRAAAKLRSHDAQAYADSTELDAWSTELEQHWHEILRLADRLLTAHRSLTQRRTM